MLKYIIRRIVLLIPVLLAVTVLIFTLLYFTPGDPVLTILGDELTPESYAEVQADLGLDQPYLIQLGRYIWNVLHGDFGKSYMTGMPVADDLLSRFPTTLKLSLLSITRFSLQFRSAFCQRRIRISCSTRLHAWFR